MQRVECGACRGHVSRVASRERSPRRDKTTASTSGVRACGCTLIGLCTIGCRNKGARFDADVCTGQWSCARLPGWHSIGPNVASASDTRGSANLADLAGLSFAVSWDGARTYDAVTGGPFKGLSNVLSTFLYGEPARRLCACSCGPRLARVALACPPLQLIALCHPCMAPLSLMGRGDLPLKAAVALTVLTQTTRAPAAHPHRSAHDRIELYADLSVPVAHGAARSSMQAAWCAASASSCPAPSIRSRRTPTTRSTSRAVRMHALARQRRRCCQ